MEITESSKVQKELEALKVTQERESERLEVEEEERMSEMEKYFQGRLQRKDESLELRCSSCKPTKSL